MIVDVTEPGALDVPRTTVVVVGSGAAGIAVAEQLSRSGRAVLLLESGDDNVGTDRTASLDDLNAGESTALPYRLAEGRTRMLGGTTELWHGQCMRLHDLDLADRPWIGADAWPLTPGDLAPWYDRAETWLGVSGRGYGRERWDEHPSLPPLAWDAERLLHDFTEYMTDPMVGRTRRPALEASSLVRVVLHATVTRVVLGPDGVTGVEVAGPDGGRRVVEVDDVVLAAGGLENPRLLQLSDPDGVGLGTGRWHTGRYLQDHPIIRTAEVLPRDHRILQDRYIVLHEGRRRLFPKVRLAPGVQREQGLLDATAIFVHDHESASLDAARRLVLAARSRRRPEHVGRDLLAAARAPVPVVRDTSRRYARGLASGTRPSHVWLQLWIEQAPDAERRILLGPSLDRFGQRRAEVRWSATDQELETSRRMTRWIGEDLERLGVASIRELPAMTDDDAWRASVVDAFHPAGTTRMSADPTAGVVDPDLQVHGVRGLHVLGGSAFPTSGYANPTLTIVALALRLGQHLADRTADRAPVSAG